MGARATALVCSQHAEFESARLAGLAAKAHIRAVKDSIRRCPKCRSGRKPRPFPCASGVHWHWGHW